MDKLSGPELTTKLVHHVEHELSILINIINDRSLARRRIFLVTFEIMKIRDFYLFDWRDIILPV